MTGCLVKNVGVGLAQFRLRFYAKRPTYFHTLRKTMNRYKGLLKDTWWLWLVLAGGGIIAGSLVSFVFYSAIPISVFAFFYFAIMRYDEHGNPTGDKM